MKLSSPPSLSSRTVRIAFVLILLVGLWLRWPRVGEGLPYFYREDEAHHFNRVVNMVKSGDLHPHYFHKPSLHFYLRMPVVAASFLWTVRSGHINSVSEIVTEDPFGVGNYAFTASHPGIVKWNRAFSMLISLGVILLAYLIAAELSTSMIVRLGAAALTAISPAAIAESAVIGVDGPMGFLCALASLLTLRLVKDVKPGLFIAATIAAGFAVSTKYNAAPVALLPLAALLLAGVRRGDFLFAAIILPVVWFFVGTPYALSSIPLFLDHVAYEVWHYGVAVREGQTAEPGIPQALFYGAWLWRDGVGPLAVILALVGIGAVFRFAQPGRAAVFLLFPALFVGLMVAQRTNFPRNMVVIIPYVSVLCFLGLSLVFAKLGSASRFRPWLLASSLLVLFGFPLVASVTARIAVSITRDSREEFSRWISDEVMQHPNQEIAVAGQLQLARSVYALPGVSRFDESKESLFSLYERGFDRVVLSTFFERSEREMNFMRQERELFGIRGPQRIVQSPHINVFAFDEGRMKDLTEQAIAAGSAEVRLRGEGDRWRCEDSIAEGAEGHCWTTARISRLVLLDSRDFQGDEVSVRFELMTPWEDQSMTVGLRRSDGTSVQNIMNIAQGEWRWYEAKLPAKELAAGAPLAIFTRRVHSPADRGLSSDNRRLGVAIRHVEIR